MLYETRAEWKGRVCGSFLSPEAARHLAWLGVAEQTAAAAIPVPSATITEHHGRSTDISIANKNLTGLALPRQILEQTLLDEVANRGGRVQIGRRITADDIEQLKKESLVVLADGRFSIASAFDKPGEGWYGWHTSFRGADQKPGDLSLHFYPRGYVGTLTFSDNVTNVCGLVYKNKNEHIAWSDIFDEALARQPFLARLLKNSTREGEWRGVGPLPYSAGMRVVENAVLAGDAAAVGDPFFGEGIARALAAGPMLFQAARQTTGGQAPNFPELKTAYDALWKKNYGMRLKLGLGLRACLKRPLLYRPLFRVTLAHPKVLEAARPVYHGGFA
jgi:flavin-dependent dehydrogenase